MASNQFSALLSDGEDDDSDSEVRMTQPEEVSPESSGEAKKGRKALAKIEADNNKDSALDGWSTVVKAPVKRAQIKAIQPAEKLPLVNLHEIRAAGCTPSMVDREINVRLFQTDIVRIERDGTVVLSTGGWYTHRTYEGIQVTLKALAPTVSLTTMPSHRIPIDGWVAEHVDGPSYTFLNDMAVVPNAVADHSVLAAAVELALIPENYLCKICKKPGHWIQKCPETQPPPSKPAANTSALRRSRVVEQRRPQPEPAPKPIPQPQLQPPANAAAAVAAPIAAVPPPLKPGSEPLIQELCAMSGCEWEHCKHVLQQCAGDVNAAAEALLLGAPPPFSVAEPPPAETAAHEPQASPQELDICSSFVNTSSCDYGDRGRYAHMSAAERNVTRPETQPLCFQFQEAGRCQYGDRCRFRHDARPLVLSQYEVESQQLQLQQQQQLQQQRELELQQQLLDQQRQVLEEQQRQIQEEEQRQIQEEQQRLALEDQQRQLLEERQRHLLEEQQRQIQEEEQRLAEEEQQRQMQRVVELRLEEQRQQYQQELRERQERERAEAKRLEEEEARARQAAEAQCPPPPLVRPLLPPALGIEQHASPCGQRVPPLGSFDRLAAAPAAMQHIWAPAEAGAASGAASGAVGAAAGFFYSRGGRGGGGRGGRGGGRGLMHRIGAFPLAPNESPRALTTLCVDEVCALLTNVELGQYAKATFGHSIGGADLALATDADLSEWGIALGVHRRRLLMHVSAFVADGVPASLLGAGIGAQLEDDSTTCVICMNAPRQMVLVPCGHLCVCEGCSHSLRDQCPICRQTLDCATKVFT